MSMLPEESSIILSLIHKCDKPDIVEEIINRIGESDLALHKVAYEEAMKFYKLNGRFPEFAFFKKEFPQLNLGAEYTGDFSNDIITKFITDLVTEHARVRVQECVAVDDFIGASEMCIKVLKLSKDLEQYTPDEAIQEYDKNKGKKFNLLSGIKQIDDTVGGFSYGHLSVIAAPPACFKTTLAQNIAYYALSTGFKVAFLSFELTKANILNNMVSRHSAFLNDYLPARHINKHLLEDKNEYEKYVRITKDFEKRGLSKNLFLASGEDMTIWDPPFITKLIEQIDKKMDGLDVVILDYIQLCRSLAVVSDKKDTTSFVNAIIAHFSYLSKYYKDRGLMVFLLSQLNREGMKEMGKHDGNKGMSLPSLAEFNALEREASVVIMLHASDMDKSARKLKMKVVKNRHGETNEEPIQVMIDPTTGVIGEHNFKDVINLETAMEVSQNLNDYDPTKDVNNDSLY